MMEVIIVDAIAHLAVFEDLAVATLERPEPAGQAVGVGQALRRVGLHVLKYLELTDDLGKRQVRYFLRAALVAVWHRAYYLAIARKPPFILD